ncbi:DUF99 family protein [Thiohalorhabdus sp. Cl-TMA]|uniref:DUF99 family protein n=1 Tax=Thiohalorhabdus methylotrophus TaxID=3242694 RepID=A0ABV4TQC1_9GAMM
MGRVGFAHAIGFDDVPFGRDSEGPVRVVGAVFARDRLDGVVSGHVRRDGADATATLIRLVAQSRFHAQLKLILLQGVAVAGFNVVDPVLLHHALGIPVLVVSRRAPDRPRIRRALLERVPDGARKWAVLERLGPMEPVAGVHVQRAGLTPAEAEQAVHQWALHGKIPEPLRTAHLIAGGVGDGHSRGRT